MPTLHNVINLPWQQQYLICEHLYPYYVLVMSRRWMDGDDLLLLLPLSISVCCVVKWCVVVIFVRAMMRLQSKKMFQYLYRLGFADTANDTTIVDVIASTILYYAM